MFVLTTKDRDGLRRKRRSEDGGSITVVVDGTMSLVGTGTKEKRGWVMYNYLDKVGEVKTTR